MRDHPAKLREAHIISVLDKAERIVAQHSDLVAALTWCVKNDGECLGDNPNRLAQYRKLIAKAKS